MPNGQPNQPARATIRMYRHGLGDCHLLRFPRADNKTFSVVIDCGLILGAPDAQQIMRNVVQDLKVATADHIDLFVATHEHWDHLSGILQARDLWSQLTVDKVWLGWTESPDDPLAQKLRDERTNMRAALTVAANRMHLAGDSRSAQEVAGLLEFFGAAGSDTTTKALEEVRKLSRRDIRYCFPQDPPLVLEGTSVRAYVLGPPHDEKLIKKYNPSTREPETYGIDSMADGFGRLQDLLKVDDDTAAPFDEALRIPTELARGMPFFQQSYWGEAGGEGADQSWRRIDSTWIESSSNLALQLDSATNNTSLVLAFELPGGDVLLFAADAQVGNWLSWQDLNWFAGGQLVTGPDLLARTIFYKVGHHGSHNATLRTKGLEQMSKLAYAFIPVDRKMALAKRWGQMPFGALVDALEKFARKGVLVSDQSPPQGVNAIVGPNSLYFELSL